MGLLDHRLLIVGGKGGVGRSVVSAALASLAAERGKRVLLVGVDCADRTGALLEAGVVGPEPRRVRPGLDAVNLEPLHVARDFIELHLPMRSLARQVSSSAVFRYWFEATPMLRELMLLGKVWHLATQAPPGASEPSYDLLVVESPATGHGLGFLQASENAACLLVGPMRKKADAMNAFLRDSAQTRMVIVTLAEEMPVNEACELAVRCEQELGIALGPMVVNAVFEGQLSDPSAPLTSAAELQAGGLDAGLAARAAEALEYVEGRGREAQRQRAELARRFSGSALELPWVDAVTFGSSEVDALARVLARQLEGVAL
jgi:hypothetical protein